MTIVHIDGPCLACGRPYNARSEPFWIFDERLRVIGSAHTRCWERNQRRWCFWLYADKPREVAELILWSEVKRDPDYPAIEWLAQLLAGKATEVSEELNADQQMLLDHWRKNGPRPFAYYDKIIPGAYAAMVREYRQWREKIP